MANLISFTGTIEQLQLTGNAPHTYISFRIRQVRKVKDKEYVTCMPAKLKASEWALNKVKEGAEILLIGRLQQEIDGSIYAAPTEIPTLWHKFDSMEHGAHTTGNYQVKPKPRNAGEATFRL